MRLLDSLVGRSLPDAMTSTVPSLPKAHRLPPHPRLGRLPAVRFGTAHSALLVAAATFTALGVAPRPALAVLVVVTVGWARRLPLGYATALGVIAWAYYTGFAVNAYGLLTFGAGDLGRLVLFVALAVGTKVTPHLR